MGKAGEKPTEPDRKSIPKWLMPAAIIVACIAAYFPILNIGFLSDDWLILNKIRQGNISDIGADGLFFRPLVVISFAIDWHIFGQNAYGFHIVNLLFHIAASFGIAAVAGMLIRKQYARIIAGVIFALHPVHPEAVSWIAGRYDVFCGAFIVWALYFHLRSMAESRPKRFVMQAISLILFLFACLSKEMALAFPLVILLLDFMPPINLKEQARSLKARIVRIAPFFVIALLWFILRWMRLKGIGGDEYLPGEAQALMSRKTFYQLLIEPFVILVFPMSRAVSNQSPGIIVTGIVFLLPLLLIILKQNWRPAIFCAAAIIVSYLPTAYLGIEVMKLESSRFLYIPSIFFALLMASLLVSVERKHRVRSVAVMAGILYFCGLFAFVYANNQTWKETGLISAKAILSSDILIEEHAGEWGDQYKKILAVGVPDNYLGAYIFRWGFRDMLQLRHGDELKGVEIEVIHEYVDQAEAFRRIGLVHAEGGIIWAFDHEAGIFFEFDPAKSEKNE